MYYLLFGEDTYSSRQKINQLKKPHLIEGAGDVNIITLDGETASFDEIVRQVQAVPFLADKRLVIIKNLLIKGSKDIQEKIAQYLTKIPSQTEVIFWEQGVPDKRLKLFKELFKQAQVQEFLPITGASLISWIKKEVAQRSGKITSEAAQRLALSCGSDLWRLNQEIEKLIAFKAGKMIEEKDVAVLVKTQISPNIFEMIDAIAGKNAQIASKKLHELIEAGENEIYLHSMITYQFRNLLMIQDMVSPQISRYQIIQKTGLHPFVVQKSLIQIKNFSPAKLRKIYAKLLAADIAMKTGKIEPGVALDLLIVGLCG